MQALQPSGYKAQLVLQFNASLAATIASSTRSTPKWIANDYLTVTVLLNSMKTKCFKAPVFLFRNRLRQAILLN